MKRSTSSCGRSGRRGTHSLPTFPRFKRPETSGSSRAPPRAMADACTAWGEQNKQVAGDGDSGLGRQLDRIPRDGRRCK